MNKAGFNKKETLRKIAIILLIVLFFSSCLLVVFCWEKGIWPFSGKDNANEFVNTGSSLSYQGQDYIPRYNVETFLVMGLDKFEMPTETTNYYNDQQADFLTLFVFDHEAKTYSAIHIDRDTMVEMDVLGVTGEKTATVTQQIALSHTYGNGLQVSCENTRKCVSNLLFDTKVDHYLSVTMEAVSILNDMVGGVEVEVLDDFTGIDDTLVKGETVTLKGEQALRYVRTRYGMDDSTNRTRMLRQQQYMAKLFEKTSACVKNDDTFIFNVAQETGEYLVTDQPIDQLQRMFEQMSSYTFTEIRAMDGSYFDDNRFIEFYPDEDSIKKIIVDLFYKPNE